jgi:AAA+ ATPase superfamily predicted ATPase
MKRFLFNTLLNEDEICNLASERKAIQKAVERGSKLVVYGRRNFGKTSL